MSGKAIRVEVISYFNQHPHRRCTCDEIADILQKDRAEVEPQLESLVRLGILDRYAEGETAFYGARSNFTGEKGRHGDVGPVRASGGDETPAMTKWTVRPVNRDGVGYGAGDEQRRGMKGYFLPGATQAGTNGA